MADIQYYGTGRRKTSTARVYLRPGGGEVRVNRKAFETYFPNETLRMIIRQPVGFAVGNQAFAIEAGQPGAKRAEPHHAVPVLMNRVNAVLGQPVRRRVSHEARAVEPRHTSSHGAEPDSPFLVLGHAENPRPWQAV